MSLVFALVVAGLLIADPDTGPVPDVEGDHPGAAAAVHGRPGRVAQHLPARDLQPDAARARHHQGAEPAELAQGIRLRHRHQPVRRLRDPAQGRHGRQRPALRPAAARRDDRRLRRRHGAEGQERLVLDDVPAAARPAHLRPDAVHAGGQQPLPAVRRLRQELLRLQPERGLPGRPQRQRRLLGRPPPLLRRRLPGPRARLLRHRRQRRRRDAALHGGQPRAVRAGDDLRQGLRAHDHEHVRRGRLRHLLLVRRRQARARHVAAARRRDRARRRLARAHAGARRSRSWRRPPPRSRSPATAPPPARSPPTARSSPARPRSTSSPRTRSSPPRTG